LHLKEFACRTCCGLDYACRHVARWAPSVRRIIRWRKQIGVDPTPFAAIPRIRAVAIAFIERSPRRRHDFIEDHMRREQRRLRELGQGDCDTD
jgi:hypothetical protein